MERISSFTKKVEQNIWYNDSFLNYLCDIKAISMHGSFVYISYYLNYIARLHPSFLSSSPKHIQLCDILFPLDPWILARLTVLLV